MNRRQALIAIAAISMSPALRAAPAAAAATGEAPEAARAPELLRQPSIAVIAPAADVPQLTSPLRIELAFATSPDAHVLPSSLRVLYGMLRIDITEKVRKNATLTETGLVVEKAEIPSGSHRLILQLADDKGRSCEQELRFRVA